MNTQQASKTGSTTVVSGKKQYCKPRLTTFGNVSKITQSGGIHSIADGNAGSYTRMPANMP